MKTVTVTLTEYEARALVNVANVMGDALEGHAIRMDEVPPLRSGTMKIETQMTIEQIEV